jgi:hypothetical protein
LYFELPDGHSEQVDAPFSFFHCRQYLTEVLVDAGIVQQKEHINFVINESTAENISSRVDPIHDSDSLGDKPTS